MNEHHIDLNNMEIKLLIKFQQLHEENIRLKILMILMLMFELILIEYVHFVDQQLDEVYEQVLI